MTAATPSEEVVEAACIWNQSANPTYHLRSPDRIARFFDGLDLVELGVVSHDGAPSPARPASRPRSIRSAASPASRSTERGARLGTARLTTDASTLLSKSATEPFSTILLSYLPA